MPRDRRRALRLRSCGRCHSNRSDRSRGSSAVGRLLLPRRHAGQRARPVHVQVLDRDRVRDAVRADAERDAAGSGRHLALGLVGERVAIEVRERECPQFRPEFQHELCRSPPRRRRRRRSRCGRCPRNSRPATAATCRPVPSCNRRGCRSSAGPSPRRSGVTVANQSRSSFPA